MFGVIIKKDVEISFYFSALSSISIKNSFFPNSFIVVGSHCRMIKWSSHREDTMILNVYILA